jgi:hypothetical protein
MAIAGQPARDKQLRLNIATTSPTVSGDADLRDEVARRLRQRRGHKNIRDTLPRPVATDVYYYRQGSCLRSASYGGDHLLRGVRAVLSCRWPGCGRWDATVPWSVISGGLRSDAEAMCLTCLG